MDNHSSETEQNKNENKEKESAHNRAFFSRYILLGSVIVLIIAVIIVRVVLHYQPSFTLQKVNIEIYKNEDLGFSFKYNTEMFELDEDSQDIYGPAYIIGMVVKDDHRTGCDVRRLQQTLNLDREISELTTELSEQLGSGNSDFKTINSDFTAFGGKEGIEMDIHFIGPIGDKQQIKQVFIPDGNYTYTLICGGNVSLQKFYQKEYNRFFDTFDFTKKD